MLSRMTWMLVAWSLAASTLFQACSPSPTGEAESSDDGDAADLVDAVHFEDDRAAVDTRAELDADVGLAPDEGPLDAAPEAGPQRAVKLPYDYAAGSLAAPREHHIAWTGVDWDRDGARAPYVLDAVVASELLAGPGFRLDTVLGAMVSDPDADVATVETAPLLLTGGEGVMLWISELFHGVRGVRTVRIQCDDGPWRDVAWVRGEAVFDAFVLPDDVRGQCVLQLELRDGSINAWWEIRGLTLVQWHGAVAWEAQPGLELGGMLTAVHAAGRTWVNGLSDDALEVVAMGPGGGWVSCAVIPPQEPVRLAAVLSLDDEPVLLAAGESAVFAGERTAVDAFGAWRRVLDGGATGLFAVPDGVLVVQDAEARDPALVSLDTALGERWRLPLSLGNSAAVVGVSGVEGGYVVTVQEADLVGLLHVGCSDGCQQPVASDVLWIPQVVGPVDVLGTGLRVHVAGGSAAGDGISELWLHAGEQGLVLDHSVETPFVGARPLLGFMGTAHVMVYERLDGTLGWAYRPTVELSGDAGWTEGPDLGREVRIDAASLVRVQVEAEWVFLAGFADGSLARRSISRAASHVLLAEHGLEVSVEDEVSAGSSPWDQPVAVHLGAGVWGWPRPLFPEGLQRLELCGDGWCDACGFSANCMGIHLSSVTSLAIVVHEIGHHVAPNMRGALAAAGVFEQACTAGMGAELLVPVYEVDGALHYAGFSPAGHYYDCRGPGDDFDHHFINVANAFMGDGERLRRLAAADADAEVEGIEPWRTLLADKTRWVRDEVFEMSFRADGVPCVGLGECGSGP